MDMAKAVIFPLPLLGVAYQQLIHGMLKAFLHVSLFSSQSGYHMEDIVLMSLLVYIEPMYRGPSRGPCIGIIYLTLLGFGGIQVTILSYPLLYNNIYGL